MATWEDVGAVALALPEVEQSDRSWSVRGKGIAWDRPLRTGDRAELGAAAPDGPILCVYTGTVVARDELLARRPDACFLTAHFRGYPAVLVRLEVIDRDELSDALVEAWLARAPTRVASQWLTEHPTGL